MKNTFLYQLVLIFSTLTLSLSSSFGQTPVDALLMPKGTACAVVQHSSSSWENYWEGTLKRDNGNIGKFTMQSTAVMGAVGILSNRFNLIAMLPYISTSATAGTMAGQKGIQDLSVWGKYKIAEVQTKNGAFAVFGVLGASSPLTSYVPDMQPFSIGLGAKSASGKVILNYTANSGDWVWSNSTIEYRIF